MNDINYKRIKRNVMRRVYTAYAGRLLSSRAMLYSSMFLASLAVFAHTVHVHKVFVNFASQPLAHAPQFVLNALLRGEVITLVAIGVMVFTALSIQWQVKSMLWPRVNLA